MEEIEEEDEDDDPIKLIQFGYFNHKDRKCTLKDMQNILVGDWKYFNEVFNS